MATPASYSFLYDCAVSRVRMSGHVSSGFEGNTPMWWKPTESAWSTLSVDCCPPPRVHVPKAIPGMVVPVHKQHGAQLLPHRHSDSSSKLAVVQLNHVPGHDVAQWGDRYGGWRAQAVTVKTAWRGKACRTGLRIGEFACRI